MFTAMNVMVPSNTMVQGQIKRGAGHVHDIGTDSAATARSRRKPYLSIWLQIDTSDDDCQGLRQQ